MFRLLIFIFLPCILFSQDYNYRSYDKALQFYNQNKITKSKNLLIKLVDNYPDWEDPNLLLSSIYLSENNIDTAVMYLLNIYSDNNFSGMKKIADIFYERGEYEKALIYFNKIIHLDQDINFYIKNCEFAIDALNNPVKINPTNIGSSVNTDFPEYINTLSIDGKKLFFTRRVKDNMGYPQEDFYVSQFDSANGWSSASPLVFNTRMNEGAMSVSSNGILYVYTACDRSNSYGGCDLYIREYNVQTGWSKEYNLGNDINTRHWESQPCFSVNNDYLYFVSNRPGGFGKSDIWRAKIVGNKFFDIENLGSSINTEKHEMSPFLHPDDLTLYFASNGHIGLGDYDLFVSRRDSIKNEWSFPLNLGYPINTYKSENSLIVSSNGETAFYSSNKSGYGKEDIFTFTLPENIKAKKISSVEIDIITKEKGDEIVLKNVQFSNNSFQLKGNSFVELDKLVKYLKEKSSVKILIEGHTNNIGQVKSNQILSENRARIVYEYLIEKGVDPKQLVSFIGFGDSRPIESNITQKGREKNRRTSFRIIN